MASITPLVFSPTVLLALWGKLRGAAGAQQLARGDDYRFSWEISPSVSLRLAGPLDLFAGYQRRNYSLLSRHGWYQGFFITLGVRP